jgi:hypothetical protein
MDLQEIGWKSLNWIDLAQERKNRRAFENAVVNIGAP